MARLVVRSLFEDIKNFMNMLSYRAERIAAAEEAPLPASYKTNELAVKLHPESQQAIVSSVSLLNENIKVLTLSSADGCFAKFRAGQGVNIKKGNYTEFFPLLSSPSEGDYKIMVFSYNKNAVSEYLFSAEKGENIDLSGPFGLFYYSPIRDADKVALLCDESGVAPVISVCKDLTEKKEDIEIKLFYLKEDNSVGVEALTDFSGNIEVCAKDSLSELKSEIKAISSVSSFFISGKNSFCEEIKATAEQSAFCKGRSRIFVSDASSEVEDKGRSYNCKIIYRDKTFDIECKENETLLSAFQKNGIPNRAKCKIGECGYCRCKLLEGNTEVIGLADVDSVRSADKKYNFIHPCRSFPKSDLVILI